MELLDKVRAVENVLANLDAEISSFQKWSGLRCGWGCGKCCFKPDIEASVLEFLPFAHYLYERDLAFEWLEKLRGTTPADFCVILDPTSNGAGLCSEYQHRGLICRLFGYSARKNKYGKRELITCQIIKSEQSSQFQEAAAAVEGEQNVPLMSDYYMQLHGIDYTLAQQFLPINEAIKRAIETILHYYAYRT